MPLFLERNDLCRIETDAVVLPANPWLEEGRGVSRSLFKAAGVKKLEAACQKLGYVDYGKAVMTSGFDLPAKYIIHAIVPLFVDLDDEEASRLLRSCYEESLKLAARNGLRSIAFPLLSSGTLRWPKRDALRIASEAIIDFMSEGKPESDGHDFLKEMETEPGDMNVYLVLYDEESTSAAENLYGDIRKYIDDNYVEMRMDELPDMSGFFMEEPSHSCKIAPEPAMAVAEEELPVPEEKTEPEEAPDRRKFRWSTFFGSGEAKQIKPEPSLPAMPAPAVDFDAAEASESLESLAPGEGFEPDQSLEDILETKTESFNDVLIRLVNESGLSNPEIYTRANISKQQFSKIMSNKVVPKKSTIFALAIGLSLSFEDTELLLMKAGYAVADSSVFDLGISYFIKHEIYDIFTVNLWLYDNKLPLLGSSSM